MSPVDRVAKRAVDARGIQRRRFNHDLRNLDLRLLAPNRGEEVLGENLMSFNPNHASSGHRGRTRCDSGIPSPVAHFGHILAVTADILFMLDELVAACLLQIRAFIAQLR